jgi:hypothetical protein
MPRATVELVTSTLPTLRLDFPGDALNPRPHAALIHRVAAWLEEQCNGKSWIIAVDARNATIAIDVLPPREAERAEAMALLERAAAKVNQRPR